MKIRTDFVTNSSSSSFIITNKSNEIKTLVDFVKENPQLIVEFVTDYNWYAKDPNYNQENLIKSVEEENYDFTPNSSKRCVFGDEDGTLIGHVFDYILRDGGESKNFRWRYYESLR